MNTASVTKVILQGEDRTQQALNSAETGLGRLKSTAVSLSASFATIFGAGATVLAGLAARELKGIADNLDNLSKSAQSVGLTTESLSALRYAAGYAGLESAQLDKALGKLTSRAADVFKGNEEAAQAFKLLGVAVKDSSGAMRATDELLGDVAESFAKAKDGPEKTALAIELFGEKIGPKLIPLLNGGRAGLEAMKKEAERLGLVIGGDAAKAAEQFKDELTRLDKQWEAVKIGIGIKVIPALAELIKSFNDAKIAGLGLEGALRSLAGPGGNYGEMMLSEMDTLTKLNDKFARLQQSKGRIATLEFGVLANGGYDRIEKELKAQIARQEALTKLLAVKAGKSVSGITQDPFADATNLGGDGTRRLGTLTKPDNAESEAQKLLKSIQDRIAATAELTEYEKALIALDAAKKPGTQVDIERALSMAKFADAAKKATEAEKAQVDLQKIIDEAQGRENQRIDALAQSYKDLADPVEKYRKQLEEIESLRRGKKLTDDQAAEAALNVQEKIDQAIGFTIEKTTDATDAARQLGLTFTSAFEAAILDGKSLSEVLRGLARDVAGIFLRKQFTEPAANALSKLFKSSFGGATLFDQLASVIGGTSASATPAAAGSGIVVQQNNSFSQGVTQSFVTTSMEKANQSLVYSLVDSNIRRGN